MHGLLQSIQTADVAIYHVLNSFTGNKLLDTIVAHQESNALFKGCAFLGAYWYFWFRPGIDQPKNRKAIVGILLGTMLAIIVTRMLAGALPFRIRPIYDPQLQHHLSLPITDFEKWSSFPSDTAAFLCALAFGLTVLSRRLTIPVWIYAIGWVCFPRLYLGIHYASDLLVGSLIAVGSVWLVLRCEALYSPLATWLAALADSKPQWFYGAGFVVSYEMAAIFWDVRSPMNGLLKLVHTEKHHPAVFLTIAAVAALCALALGAYLALSPRTEATSTVHRIA